MERERVEINGFNPSFMGGHWIKVVEVVMGVVLLVRGLVWVIQSKPSSCMATFLEESMVAMGALLILVSCMGLLGALLRQRALLWAHLWALILLALLLLSFAVFTLEVTRGPPVLSSGELSDYPAWFQHRVHNAKRWHHIVACLQRSNICLRDSTHSTPIQYGCCRPPTSCGYTYIGGTQWNPPINQTNTSLECMSWSNNPSQLCYQCISCKVAVIQETRSKWKIARTVLLIVLVTILTLYVFCGCGLFNYERSQDY